MISNYLPEASILHFLPPFWPDATRMSAFRQDLHASVTRDHRCRSRAGGRGLGGVGLTVVAWDGRVHDTCSTSDGLVHHLVVQGRADAVHAAGRLIPRLERVIGPARIFDADRAACIVIRLGVRRTASPGCVALRASRHSTEALRAFERDRAHGVIVRMLEPIRRLAPAAHELAAQDARDEASPEPSVRARPTIQHGARAARSVP